MGEEDRPVDRVVLDCQCGESVAVDDIVGRVACRCGRLYAVTVTEMRGPEDSP